jgi:glycosyltransferase involved in cell wall biosynthesis
VFAEAIQEMADHGGILHAHTLFSDGGLAYEFSKQTRLPYFITVRNTDLNVFWKYMLHLRIYGRRILENASGIVFLSESYRNRLKNRVPESFWSKIGPKSQVIPNGIEGHWFGESFPRIPAEGIRLLYLGRFDKNKNLVGIIQAAKSLRSHGFPISLRMVGAKGAYADFIRSQYAHDWIEYINYTKDTTELKKHFAWASVFIMPSFTESFGLVYAEALSQGVPVIYSKGQGFDGWCPDEQCGLGVDPRNISEISSAISTLARNQNSQSCVALAQRFRWEKIAEEYRSLYGDILRRLA